MFEATIYSVKIDVWSVGAVFGELLLGAPVFPGDSSVDQLIEIIKVLGTCTTAHTQSGDGKRWESRERAPRWAATSRLPLAQSSMSCAGFPIFVFAGTPTKEEIHAMKSVSSAWHAIACCCSKPDGC